MDTIRPHITVLTRNQIEQVHNYSLKLLATNGIRVDSKRAREIFTIEAGIKADNDIIRIPADAVENALKSAPSVIDIFDRTGNHSFSIPQKENPGTHFGIGVTNLWYQDPETDDVVPFSRKHIATATKLGHTLDNFDVVSTPGVIKDDKNTNTEVLAALEMIANTTKPLVVLVSNIQQYKLVLEMLQHLHGDLSRKPFIIPYFNPVTPFVMNEETTDKMFLTIEYGLPFIFSNYGMSGATTPITGAGTLVTLNAELLAGLVFSQLVKPGTPILLGSLPSVFEMKNMFSAYTSQTMLVNLVCAEMMDHYHIPHCGTSGSGSGWGPDLQASGTLWLNHLTSCLGKVGLAPFVGGNFDSLAFSPTMVVYANEVIRQARMFSRGFMFDEDSVGLENIISEGPGGNFFMSKQTLALYRDVDKQHSGIWPGYTLEKWLQEKSPKAIELLREHTMDIIKNLEPPDDHDQLIEKGEDFIKKINYK